MKKHVFILAFLFATIQIFSQVGINTTEPKATLDIVGKPSESNVLDGLIVPRITAIQLKAKKLFLSAERCAHLCYRKFYGFCTGNRTGRIGKIGWTL